MEPDAITRLLGFLGFGVLVPQFIGLLPRLVPKWKTPFYPTLIGGFLAAASFFAIARIWLGLEVDAIQSEPGGYACGTFVGVMFIATLFGTAFHFAASFVINLLARHFSIRRNRKLANGVQT